LKKHNSSDNIASGRAGRTGKWVFGGIRAIAGAASPAKSTVTRKTTKLLEIFLFFPCFC
jgi:hypothetical protein